MTHSSKSDRRGMTSSRVGPEHLWVSVQGAAVVRAAAWRARLRLRVPLVTSHRAIRTRDAAIVLLVDEEGRRGWGEATPLVGFGRPRRTSLLVALCDYLREARGRTPVELLERLRVRPPRDASTAAVVFALETAALDLLGKANRTALRELFRPGASDRVPVNALISASSPVDVAAAALHAKDSRFTAVKMKVGGRPLSEDVVRVRAAREALGPTIALRLDANGAWSETEAVRAVTAFAPYAIEYIEQPLPPGNLPALARLRAASPVPLAVDEDASSPESLNQVLTLGVADVVVLKPSVFGGLLPTWAAATNANARGVVAVMSSALEGTIGLVAAAQLAAALPGAPRPHGLGTGDLLIRDTAMSPPMLQAGVLVLPNEPGLGVEPAGWVIQGSPLVEVQQ